MAIFYVIQPIATMREGPTRNSKVVSQAIFAEKISCIKEQAGWSYINSSDGYGGWIPSEAIIRLDAPYDGSIEITRLAAHVYGIQDTEFGPLLTLPYGVKLHPIDMHDLRWAAVALPDGRVCYIQQGDIAPEPPLQNKGDLVEFSQKFLHLPYTWGGRSSFGYDCSGFVQMLYGRIGINLPRDAREQMADPRLQPIDLNDLERGDLIFFGKSDEQIKHVGLYLGDGHFIHSTARENKPYLRISNLLDFEWSGHSKATYPYRAARRLKI